MAGRMAAATALECRRVWPRGFIGANRGDCGAPGAATMRRGEPGQASISCMMLVDHLRALRGRTGARRLLAAIRLEWRSANKDLCWVPVHGKLACPAGSGTQRGDIRSRTVLLEAAHVRVGGGGRSVGGWSVGVRGWMRRTRLFGSAWWLTLPG